MDSQEVWDAMKTETLEGIPLSQIIGGGEPQKICEMTLQAIDTLTPLKSTLSVLDIGCGCGRIAAGLTEALSPQARYVGIDIVPGLIGFAKRHIAANNRNFQFWTLDQGNPSYDWFRRRSSYDWFRRRFGNLKSIAKISDVVPDGSIDLVIATSLFTHLDFPEARTLLRDIAKTLSTKGRLYMSCFVLDDHARQFLGTNEKVRKSAFSFAHAALSGKAFIERADEPNYAVAYSIAQMNHLLDSAGLKCLQLRHGDWRGETGNFYWQDEIFAGK